MDCDEVVSSILFLASAMSMELTAISASGRGIGLIENELMAALSFITVSKRLFCIGFLLFSILKFMR